MILSLEKVLKTKYRFRGGGAEYEGRKKVSNTRRHRPAGYLKTLSRSTLLEHYWNTATKESGKEGKRQMGPVHKARKLRLFFFFLRFYLFI